MTDWTLEILPRRGLFHLPFRQLWEYRDLLLMLVQRDMVTLYKQTILGPIWYVLQPLLTMLMFILVFGNIAGFSTDGLPQPLFYLAGIVIWNYFSETLTRTSITFTLNAEIFGKVYFPRLAMPLSLVISGMIKFLIQLGLFLAFYLWYLLFTDRISPNLWLIATPYLAFLMAMMGLGFGITLSSLTTKYRDLNMVVPFLVQLLLYATPIIYPMSEMRGPVRNILWWNPLSHIVEAFRHAFLGVGEVSLLGLVYSSLFTLLVLFSGVLIFNRTEQDFMDTV
ncbi:ABC transporter permease [Planctomicrobium sp. SH668]|uniref:ABC transporter permease n=1 Tax=Planctomicrobium sp. SH668 TaxID=3448126 RepID=UPI003F5CAF67